MKAKKQLIVCLTVCVVVSFVATVYAARLEEPIRSAPVTVVNPASKPIPVTEVNKYPVQNEVAGKFVASAWLTNKVLYTVPDGKRLVIEYFSCRNSTVGSYSTAYTCGINTGGYPGVHHWLPTTPYGHSQMSIGSDTTQSSLNPAFISAGQTVKIYAYPGTDVLAVALRQNQAISSFINYPEEYIYFSFSGYLTDVAQ
jgi:hypothetical protein